ncbi:hypothetical protein B0H14DRAFT_2349640, partial [Mycena olivaceomarginata]
SELEKIDDMLRTYDFRSLGTCFAALFQPRIRGVKDLRTKRHRQAVSSFLQGRSSVKMGHIVPLIYNHPQSRAKRNNSRDRSAAFSPDIPLIGCAQPCLSAWATRSVGNHLYLRIGKLARKKRTDGRTRRHLRATTNGRTERTDVTEWEDVEFSIEELAQQYQAEDGTVWYITECLAASRKNGAIVINKNRPHPVVCGVGKTVRYISSGPRR